MAKYSTDLLFGVGLLVAAAGVWWFSPAAALLFVGIVLMCVALAMAAKGRG